MAFKSKIFVLWINISWVLGLCLDQSENYRFLVILDLQISRNSEFLEIVEIWVGFEISRFLQFKMSRKPDFPDKSIQNACL